MSSISRVGSLATANDPVSAGSPPKPIPIDLVSQLIPARRLQIAPSKLKDLEAIYEPEMIQYVQNTISKSAFSQDCTVNECILLDFYTDLMNLAALLPEDKAVFIRDEFLRTFFHPFILSGLQRFDPQSAFKSYAETALESSAAFLEVLLKVRDDVEKNFASQEWAPLFKEVCAEWERKTKLFKELISDPSRFDLVFKTSVSCIKNIPSIVSKDRIAPVLRNLREYIVKICRIWGFLENRSLGLPDYEMFFRNVFLKVETARRVQREDSVTNNEKIEIQVKQLEILMQECAEFDQRARDHHKVGHEKDAYEQAGIGWAEIVSLSVEQILTVLDPSYKAVHRLFENFDQITKQQSSLGSNIPTLVGYFDLMKNSLLGIISHLQDHRQALKMYRNDEAFKPVYANFLESLDACVKSVMEQLESLCESYKNQPPPLFSLFEETELLARVFVMQDDLRVLLGIKDQEEVLTNLFPQKYLDFLSFDRSAIPSVKKEPALSRADKKNARKKLKKRQKQADKVAVAAPNSPSTISSQVLIQPFEEDDDKEAFDSVGPVSPASLPVKPSVTTPSDDEAIPADSPAILATPKGKKKKPKEIQITVPSDTAIGRLTARSAVSPRAIIRSKNACVAEQVLNKLGLKRIRTRGSHHQYADQKGAFVTVVEGKELSYGVRRNIAEVAQNILNARKPPALNNS